jgi:hypothetical protein
MHVYDTTRPITQSPRQPRRSLGTHTTTMHVAKTIDGIGDGWTITDSHLSPDNERLAYAVMGSKVYLAKIRNRCRWTLAIVPPVGTRILGGAVSEFGAAASPQMGKKSLLAGVGMSWYTI